LVDGVSDSTRYMSLPGKAFTLRAKQIKLNSSYGARYINTQYY